MAYKGIYKPINPTKYVGDVKHIQYRSLWERTCMKFFDQSSSILKWSSEEIIVPYISPKDNRFHRYYPDFIILAKTKDVKEKITMIEVKPLSQTLPPKQPKKKTRKYFAMCATYAINMAKWDAATKFCKVRHWDFKILTEKDLY